MLRATALDVPGLDVEPQVPIWGDLGLTVRPDLVDRRLRIVLEADSFEWHGDRAALRRDARRYDLLVANGWVVLRFAWEDVMFHPDYVRECLEAVFPAVPYCVDLIGGPYMETHESVVKAFRPKSALRKP